MNLMYLTRKNVGSSSDIIGVWEWEKSTICPGSNYLRHQGWKEGSATN